MANVPGETDSERDRDRKETVAAAKKELLAYVKEGGSVNDFLRNYRTELRAAHETWKMMQREAIRTMERNPEEAPVIISEMNKRLEEKGIKHLNIPPSMQEHFNVKLPDDI